MTIKDLGTNMDRQWRIDLNDNFRELSGMQGSVNDAVAKASTMQEQVNVELQVNNLDEEVNLISSNKIKNNGKAIVSNISNTEEKPFNKNILSQYQRVNMSYESGDSNLSLHFVTDALMVDSSKKQIAGFWVCQSDLNALPAGVSFYCPLIGFNSNKQWSGITDSVLSFEIPPASFSIGYTLTKSNSSQNATLKVITKIGDWFFVEIAHNTTPNFPYWSIFIGSRRLNSSIISSFKLDIMNLTLINANFALSSSIIYPNVDNYRVRKQELNDNLFKIQRQVFNSIYKENNLLTTMTNGKNQTNVLVPNVETVPFSNDFIPSVLRMNYSFSGATNAYMEHKPKPFENGKTPAASVWLRKSQINSLVNLNLQFWLCSTDSNGVWAGVVGSNANVQLSPSDFYVGFKADAKNATDTFTLSLEIKSAVGDWIYIEWWMSRQPSVKYSWTPLLVIQGVTTGTYSGSLDTMNYRGINTEFGLSPLLINTITKSKWAFKKWGAVGDSITEKNFRTNKNYHDYIAEKINCFIYNYGVSGTGWRTPNGAGTGRPIYERISAMDPNLDLITIFAGTNDWGETGKPLVLGQFGDTDPAASFYGAVDNVFSQLITKYPTKTIAAFTPLPRGDAFNGPNGSGITLEQIADAIIKVAKKYSIPVLDLYRTSSLFPWNDTANEYYFKAVGQTSGDRLHPNDVGHQILADKILAFLNTL
ncbi:SGNH/GDSL hydrolase family protein [Bacillus toyonensis]|uniref:SGNH/GDSL hydrolase family protein n=1 Tax=Bacillus toyonensis TaxID=155322 RepID=UPI0021D06A9C|nr:SGNH/GDSL hydrolase family protein [Bacillus toyonensis]MCU5181585.1 SGNH/GDSL hydrolase family protein [Bacillus toyonensis]